MRLGLSPSEFWKLHPEEFWMFVEAKTEVKEREELNKFDKETLFQAVKNENNTDSLTAWKNEIIRGK